MLGIYLWLILIFIWCVLDTPGFLPFLLFVALPVGIGVFLLVNWIDDKLFSFNSYPPTTHHHSESPSPDRERAIDEWEKKWGRTHPTRINKK